MNGKPNRIVIEVDRTGPRGVRLVPTVRAERPDEVVVIFQDSLNMKYSATYKPSVFGGGELPILPLAVVADGLAVEYEVEGVEHD